MSASSLLCCRLNKGSVGGSTDTGPNALAHAYGRTSVNEAIARDICKLVGDRVNDRTAQNELTKLRSNRLSSDVPQTIGLPQLNTEGLALQT